MSTSTTDAAATLRALARLWRVTLPAGDMARASLELGADLPMCMAARPLVARGIGEAITPVDGLPALAMVLVNPRVVHRSEGTKVSREGCLSLPDLTANVRRPRKATVEFQDGQRDLGMNQVQLAGFEARCVLHEIDHLDGILFLDRVASITDDLFRRQTYR